jgi:hypothetical protein
MISPTQLYQLIPEPAGDWQEGDMTWNSEGPGYRLRPVPAYSGQCWRDLEDHEYPQKGDRFLFRRFSDFVQPTWQMENGNPIQKTAGEYAKPGDQQCFWQRPVQPCQGQTSQDLSGAEKVPHQQPSDGVRTAGGGVSVVGDRAPVLASSPADGEHSVPDHQIKELLELTREALAAPHSCQSSGKSEQEWKQIEEQLWQKIGQAEAERDQWQELAHEVRDCRGLFDLKPGQSLLYAIETLKAEAKSPGCCRPWLANLICWCRNLFILTCALLLSGCTIDQHGIHTLDAQRVLPNGKMLNHYEGEPYNTWHTARSFEPYWGL